MDGLFPTTDFIEDLDMDENLDSVDFTMVIEDAFGFSLPDADAVLISTLDQLICYLHRRIEKNAADRKRGIETGEDRAYFDRMFAKNNVSNRIKNVGLGIRFLVQRIGSTPNL